MPIYFTALKEKPGIGLLTHFDTRKNTRKALGLAWIWLDSDKARIAEKKERQGFLYLAALYQPKIGVP